MAKRDHELTPDEFHICCQKGTEAPFTGKYWNHKEEGTYCCLRCDAPLFSSKDKFDSGSGWPSFTKPVEESKIEYTVDHSQGMDRIEVTCKACGSHLGHVFDDGPEPTGKRYCINSASLEFHII